MTLPQVQMLNKAWRHFPPAALALRQIGAYLGIKPAVPADNRPATRDALQQASAAGLPVLQGRPNDPMLAFLDLPPAAD